MKGKIIAVLIVVLLGIWFSRFVLVRLFPIHYTGEVMRIEPFNKGGWSSKGENTRQLNQFALIFADGFNCEGSDTSFAAIKVGDQIEIRGYHDVYGYPVMNPEWWECDEAQLVQLLSQTK